MLASYRGGQAKVRLITQLFKADQVRDHGHFSPAEHLDGRHEQRDGVDQVDRHGLTPVIGQNSVTSGNV